MRHLIFCSGLVTLGVVFLHFSAVAQTTDTTSVPIRLVDGLPVVQVTLNGKGPYGFVLDTGTNMTYVQSQLLAQLSIPLGEQVAVHTVTGMSQRRKTTVESIGVGGLTVLQIEVDALDSDQRSRDHQRFSGVLGENFLKHFDILLDNKKEVLVLDRTSRLAKSYDGEHLPFSRFGSFDVVSSADRIIVELKILSYREQSLRCVVDSGANSNAIILYPETSKVWNTLLLSQPSKLRTLNGKSCFMEKSLMVVGGRIHPDTEVLVCENMTREASDSDCLLPTDLFQAILISHQNSYVIVNPRKGPRRSEEPANTVLSAR
jgi:gag-polyprotein putative aspartyl protease